MNYEIKLSQKLNLYEENTEDEQLLTTLYLNNLLTNIIIQETKDLLQLEDL